jgi:N-acetylmuramic acid 6-phosphate etherase
MIKLGFVYGNLMSNLLATNDKLRRRAQAILCEETGLDPEAAGRLFTESGEDLRLALLMARGKLSLERARELLQRNQGSVRRALEDPAS